MLPLRLVFDTNVVVSAALYVDSLPSVALALALTKPARLYVSKEVLDEYADVLGRSDLHIRKGVRVRLLQLIHNHCHVVTPNRRLEVAGDQDDNRLLECADRAGADYLVTGNTRHFPDFWKKTKIITVREFVSLNEPHSIKRGRL